jgi:hypothetical protein
MLVLEPTSKASVLAARELVSPALLSMVISARVRPVEPSIEKACTGVFRILRPVMDEVPVKE